MTVTVADDSMDNVSITVNDSIVDIAGNPLIEAVDNLQTVDTVNPSTLAGEPFVSDVVITDADAEAPSTLSVSFTFDEDMDVAIDPSVTFDPAVASTLIEGTPQGAWLGDGRTFKVDAVVADAGVDVDQVKIDITGAHDVAGNLQVDHTATVDLEIDTLNPTASYSSEILAQNQSDDVSSDDDSVVAYTVDFSEPVSGITAGDIRVDGGAVVAETVALSSDGLQATFNVQANDDSVADLVVTVKDTVTDLNGNRLVESSSAPVSVDTVNPSTLPVSRRSDLVISDADAEAPSTLTSPSPLMRIWMSPEILR